MRSVSSISYSHFVVDVAVSILFDLQSLEDAARALEEVVWH